MRRHAWRLVVFALAWSMAGVSGCSSGNNTTDGSSVFTSQGADDAYEDGVAAYNEGNLGEAERLLRQAIQGSPRYLAAYIALGKVLLDANRPDDALDTFEDALGLRENSGEAQIGRAQALILLGRPAEGIEAAESASQNGFEVQARPILAMAYESIGQLDQATTMLEQAVEAEPSRVELRLELARLYVATNQPADALPVLERAAYSNDSDPVPWRALADLQQDLELWDRAIPTWQHLNELVPGNSEILTQLGEAQLISGNYMMAHSTLDDAVQADSRNGRALVLRGRAAMPQGMSDRAQEDAEAALRLDPSNLEALDLLAEAYQAQGAIDQAITAYRDLVAAHPGDVAPAMGLARLYLEQENGAAAVEVLDPFLAQANSNPALTEVLFLAYQKAGDNNRALDYLIRYVEGRPNDPVLMLELVETALAMEGQTVLSPEDLVETAERAVQLSGGLRVEYHLAFVDALLLAGQRDRALEVANQAYGDHPSSTELRSRIRQMNE